MKNSVQHVNLIDYLRGVAALSVFFFHCLGYAYGYRVLPWGWMTRSFNVPASFIALLPFHFTTMGVPIFFAISGFCIHMSFRQQGREWRAFFIRRFFRIYPAYLVAMLLFAFFFTHGTRDFWFQFISHALLIHNFNAGTIHALNGAFWSIAVEAQLYLVYPLLLALVAKFGWRRTLIGMAGCEISLQMWDFWSYQIMSYGGYYSPFIYGLTPVVDKFGAFLDTYLKASPLGYWCSWSVGAYVADAYLNGRQISLGKLSVGAWVSLVVASYFIEPLAPLFFLCSAVLTAKLMAMYFNGARLSIRVPDFWLAQLRRVGLWSYSIYLLHDPLLKIFSTLPRRFFPAYPLFIFFCCACFLLVIMLLSGLWYHLIERPGITLGKRLIKKMAGGKKSENLPQKVQSMEEPIPPSDAVV